MKQALSGEGTGSLEKALDVLDLVGDAPAGLSQNDISEHLALPRTTVYRLLATLVNRGLLRRDAARKVYCLGFRCFEMARQAYAMPDLVAAAATELRSLRDLTGETAYLATLDGGEVISIERYDGAHSQRSSAALGQRKPIYCTSQGKAILSAMPPDERDALIRDITLKPLTPHTHTDRRRLQADLKIISARGWSMDDEEIVLGIRCVGAPVIDLKGNVRGAISVAGPAWRITRERAELLGPEVAEAARRIGAQLDSHSVVIDPEIMAIEGPWAFLGGLPRWSSAYQRLYWADLLAPSLRYFDGAQDKLLLSLETPITGLAFREGELVLVQENGVLQVSKEGKAVPMQDWPHEKVVSLCNAPNGSLWASINPFKGGSIIGEIHPSGLFDPHWNVDESVQAISWNHAGNHLYATAPDSGSVLKLAVGSTNIRRLTSLPKGSGRISGLAIDANDGVWTALRDGWSVVRIGPDGNLDRVVGLPVSCPTDLAIVEDRLYITTARQSVPLDALDKAPLSGRLLSVLI